MYYIITTENKVKMLLFLSPYITNHIYKQRLTYTSRGGRIIAIYYGTIYKNLSKFSNNPLLAAGSTTSDYHTMLLTVLYLVVHFMIIDNRVRHFSCLFVCLFVCLVGWLFSVLY